jgi:type I restriction enzyme M protein
VNTESNSQLAAFIWSVADLLGDDFKQSQYGLIILSFTLLRLLGCVLELTKTDVREASGQARCCARCTQRLQKNQYVAAGG